MSLVGKYYGKELKLGDNGNEHKLTTSSCLVGVGVGNANTMQSTI